MNERLVDPVAQVLGLLATKEYGELERLTQGVRLSAQEVAKAVADYGRTLIIPPAEAFNLMEVAQIRGSSPQRWSITMPVWTKEEGRSDLSIEMTLTDHGSGLGIEIDDLHVP